MNEMEQLSCLPDQIIMDEIFTRLPVKSLCRFKSVSKHWSAVISSAQFAKAHLHRQLYSISNSNPKWVFFQMKQNSYLLNYEAYDHEDATEKYFDYSAQDYTDPGGVVSLGKVLNAHHNGVELEGDPIGSSCGLVCLLVQGGQFCLFNPSLRQWRIISSPDPCGAPSSIFCGFGYVSPIDDFKLVVGLRSQFEGQGAKMHVFSLRNNSWRTIEGGDQLDIIATSEVYLKGMLVNERLHWWIRPTGSTNDGRIFAFNLLDEVFEEIPIPKVLSSKVPNMCSSSESNGISAMGGCLCLSVFWEDNSVEMWMLKEYGENESWVKLYHLQFLSCYEYHCAEFFGFTKTGKFLMRCWTISQGCSDVIFLVDPNQFRLSRPKLNPIWVGSHISSIENYVESLVSPFGLETPRLQEMEGDGVRDTQERITENLINGP